MRYVQPDPFGGCWLWDSGVTFNGWTHYPIFTLRSGKQQRVNRFMFEAHNGPIPQGMVVRHTCDVPMCVNPAHLIIGSHKDNAQDREQRGRSRWAGHVKPIKLPALPKEDCLRGHPLSGSNIRMYRGRRICITCANDHQRARRARRP